VATLVLLGRWRVAVVVSKSRGHGSLAAMARQLHATCTAASTGVGTGVGARAGAGVQRWVIAIRRKKKLPTTLPITSILRSWHYQLK
jgi:hypothetical protein